MADSLTIDVDTARLLAAFDRLGSEIERRALEVARVTADRIAEEARRRVRSATGKTREGITVRRDDTEGREGYIVEVRRRYMYRLPAWLEFGTRHMAARPYLFPAARLEEGPHDRRMRAAIQDAIEAAGG